MTQHLDCELHDETCKNQSGNLSSAQMPQVSSVQRPPPISQSSTSIPRQFGTIPLTQQPHPASQNLTLMPVRAPPPTSQPYTVTQTPMSDRNRTAGLSPYGYPRHFGQVPFYEAGNLSAPTTTSIRNSVSTPPGTLLAFRLITMLLRSRGNSSQRKKMLWMWDGIRV
jgi:hypothetical protein